MRKLWNSQDVTPTYLEDNQIYCGISNINVNPRSDENEIININEDIINKKIYKQRESNVKRNKKDN